MDSIKGLPGLKGIREALRLTQHEAAAEIGTSFVIVARLENGKADCRQEQQRKFARGLGCLPVDLMAPPTDVRLAEIEACFRRKQAAEAEQRAANLCGGAMSGNHGRDFAGTR